MSDFTEIGHLPKEKQKAKGKEQKAIVKENIIHVY
jgi:hypothetical protein